MTGPYGCGAGFGYPIVGEGFQPSRNLSGRKQSDGPYCVGCRNAGGSVMTAPIQYTIVVGGVMTPPYEY